MERLLMFLVICVFAKALENRNHTRFVRALEDYERSDLPPVVNKVACNSSLDNERNTITKEAECGKPRKIFYSLEYVPKDSDQLIFPKAVWFNQCQGVCQDGSKCIPKKTNMRKIPLLIVNQRTSKEECATYTVEEHESCQCAAVGRSNTGKSKMAVF